MDTVRRHLIFSGYVQGVGFRYRAYHAARGLGLSGWVKNRSDGTVELEAEGTEDAIAELVAVMERHPWAQIDRVTSERIPVQGGYSFEIL